MQWRDYVYNQLLTFLTYVVQIDTRESSCGGGNSVINLPSNSTNEGSGLTSLIMVSMDESLERAAVEGSNGD